jgi:hypothetical protein
MDKKYPKCPVDFTQFLSEDIVATRLDISRSLVRKWRRNRQGPPFVKFGACVRYDAGALADWIRGQTQDTV